MRISTILVGVSVGLNVALGALWFNLGRSTDVDLAATATGGGSTHRSAVASQSAAPTPSVWLQLNRDESPRGLVARLRSAGFPEKIVRQLVHAVIHAEFEQKRHRITGDAELHLDPRKPWPNLWMDPKLGPQLRATMKEEQEMSRALLGDGADDTEEERAQRQQRFGDLSDEKIQQVTKFWQEWNEKRLQIYANRSGRIQLLPADIEKLNEINRSLRNGLTSFLTPAEADEFLVRNSQYALQLQHMVAPLRLSEQEYRTAFALYEAYAQQFPNRPFLGNLDTVPPEQAAAQKAAAQTLVAQLNATLPADRAEQVQLALDPSFSDLNRLVNRLDLPFSAAQDVYRVQQATLQHAKALNADLSLTTDARTAQLATLQQQATADIAKALGGKRGLNAYKQLGGAWLTTLVPKPRG